MENNTTTGQSNTSTKHSILSAQADLNTGTTFHNDPVPKAPGIPVSQPASPKPLPQSVQDASEEFRKRMEMEKAKSVSSLQSTVNTIAPNLSAPVAPKPLPATPSVSLEHAESTKPLNNPFIGMSTAKPMPQHSISMSNGVVFENEAPEAASVSTSGKGHSVILTISILIILGALGGGAYYWYAFMGGKDVVQAKLNPTKKSAESVGKTPVAQKPVQAFPAAIRPVATTTPVVSKPAVVNVNTFAPTKVTAPKVTTTVPKKTTTFGDAEKEIVSSYVSANINKLSRVKSASGFSVEDIRFDGPNRAIVSYGDGDMSVSAVLNFTYTNGTVKVNSFNILEK